MTTGQFAEHIGEPRYKVLRALRAIRPDGVRKGTYRLIDVGQDGPALIAELKRQDKKPRTRDDRVADEGEVRYLTPPEIASKLRMSVDRIIDEIKRGALKAIDTRSPGALRPRYKVRPSWLEDWERSRMPVPPPPKQERPRRMPNVIDRY